MVFALEQGALQMSLCQGKGLVLSNAAPCQVLDRPPARELVQFFAPVGLSLLMPGLEGRIMSQVQSFLQELQVKAGSAVEVQLLLYREKVQCWQLSTGAAKNLPIAELIEAFAP